MGGEVRRSDIEKERTMAKSFEQVAIVAALEARLEEICLPCRKLRLCGRNRLIIPAFSRRGYAGIEGIVALISPVKQARVRDGRGFSIALTCGKRA